MTNVKDDDVHSAHNLAREAAAAYMERGWKPIPIPPKHKKPVKDAWQTIDFKVENFAYWGNVGVQFGPVSGGLCDVDLDCAEARRLAPYFLPETVMFGRKSAPRSHWLFISDLWQRATAAAVGFDDPTPADPQGEHGARLIELRTGRVDKKGVVKGALSMFPPSRHPCGETVRWDADGEPLEIDGAELEQRVRRLAAATLLVRHYPPVGKQHEGMGLVLGGFLARAGWAEEDVAHFVSAVAEAAGDAEVDDRINSAKSAVELLKRDDKCPGIPRMKKIFGEAIVTTLLEWLQVRSDTRETPRNTAPPARPRSISEVLDVFEKWLVLKDSTPVYAVLGAVAANLLPGDPVWLGVVGPPSSAKTEILSATSRLPYVVQAATLTQGSLLSGVSKRQRDRNAKGGLLRGIGELGILMMKDFGSVLSMRQDNRSEILGALREIFDGAWTRHLGTDGGVTLSWQGKMGLIFGCTQVIDAHHHVMGQMGDRFLLCRLAPTSSQFERALAHSGEQTKVMRSELAEAVSGLFANELPPPRPLSEDERKQLDTCMQLAVRLRGAVARDNYRREIEAVLGVEGTARLGLALERLLAGLDTLGVERETAFKVIEQIVWDSTPPLRLACYRYLRGRERYEATTTQVATHLGLPSSTVRRALEDLAAHKVVLRKSRDEEGGKADLWRTGPWGRPRKNPEDGWVFGDE